MSDTPKRRWGLSGTALKWLACFCMVLDHIGNFLLVDALWLRIVGRISMPIFAYLIAEGCRYTRHKARYFFRIFALGGIFLVFARVFVGLWYGCIFLTFSLSILCIYLWQWLLCGVRKSTAPRSALLRALAVFIPFLGGACVLCAYCDLEYGVFAMLLPVVIYMTYVPADFPCPAWRRLDTKWARLLLSAPVLLGASVMAENPLQYTCFLSLPLLFLYNGTPGKHRMKYFFYLFYPVHIALLFGIRYFLMR